MRRGACFQVGQRLRCVEPDRTWLRKDEVYEVREVCDKMVGLNVAPGVLWGPWRFRRVDSEGEEPP